jgi:hypothetical protein
MERIKSMLRDMGEQAIRLADSLDAGGDEKLADHEKQLIRMCLLPGITEMSDLVQMHFYFGDQDRTEAALSDLANLVRRYNDYKVLG